MPGFEIVAEITSPRRPDFANIEDQVRALSGVAARFFVPDSPVGRPSLSGLAVANVVEALGAPTILCLNCRDRNVTGLRRDLLTASAYGIESLFCVYGDSPAVGRRVRDLNVEEMIVEIREFASSAAFSGRRMFSVGAAATLGRLPSWKATVDFLVTDVSLPLPDLLSWRDGLAIDIPVYAGVMVGPLALTSTTGKLLPNPQGGGGARDSRAAAVDAACARLEAIRTHGGFAGAHLVPLASFREVAMRITAERPELAALDCRP